jgi:uncharacterized protein YjbI with pentapeptide repeats
MGFSTADFAGAGFAGTGFSAADFAGAGFAGTGFSAADFAGAGFAGAGFSAADFAGAEFAEAGFAGAGLAGGRFTIIVGFVVVTGLDVGLEVTLFGKFLLKKIKHYLSPYFFVHYLNRHTP